MSRFRKRGWERPKAGGEVNNKRRGRAVKGCELAAGLTYRA
jgi:hypothetical protein